MYIGSKFYSFLDYKKIVQPEKNLNASKNCWNLKFHEDTIKTRSILAAAPLSPNLYAPGAGPLVDYRLFWWNTIFHSEYKQGKLLLPLGSIQELQVKVK